MRKKTVFYRSIVCRALLVAGLVTLVLGLPLHGQKMAPSPSGPVQNSWTVLAAKHCPRVADPKLAGGQIPIQFFLMPVGKSYEVSIYVLKGVLYYRDIFATHLIGSKDPYTFHWDGKDNHGKFADPGDYTVVVKAKGSKEYIISFPVNIVRLGITEMDAYSDGGGNEWQMVYFMKGIGYEFYATPAICEYANFANIGEVSDLDFDDGTPRPPAALHQRTDEPVMDGADYATHCYNYPLCYRIDTLPVFEVTMGASCTSQQGYAIPCGYPIPGVEIRGLAEDETGAWTSTADNVVPGMEYEFTGHQLSSRATRIDRNVTWHWQYRLQGEESWIAVPGWLETHHRFYTVLNDPVWASGASGTQYAGPWVEVAEYLHTWSEALEFGTSDEAGVVKALVRGYFGQEASLTGAIEGVVYDTYTMGGDGGACHYYSFSGTTKLSKLLNAHANGVYVNCSDVASTAAVMIGMFGVQDIQMVHLGYMDLRALWGIGCPDYTLNLWGGGSHAFSYHHIMTRDQGVHVSDACMWLDEDGNPDALPGIPGYNHDRPWADKRIGYDVLSASNTVKKSLDPLPHIN